MHALFDGAFYTLNMFSRIRSIFIMLLLIVRIVCNFEVRKRPINKKELARSEEDIICVEENGCCLTVEEPKLKVFSKYF